MKRSGTSSDWPTTDLWVMGRGRLHRDAAMRYRYTGPHEPDRRRQFNGRFNHCDPTRLTRTTLDDAEVDLYGGEPHNKAWQC